jgi:hypothetical protein
VHAKKSTGYRLTGSISSPTPLMRLYWPLPDALNGKWNRPTCSRSAVERCVETLLATKTSSAEWRASHVENFVLDYLPPYSPELNRIERVWKLTRRQCLHNRYFPVLEEVVAVVETQFGNWRNGNETLRRFCAIT